MEQFWFPPTHMLIAYQTGTREREQPYFMDKIVFSYSENDRNETKAREHRQRKETKTREHGSFHQVSYKENKGLPTQSLLSALSDVFKYDFFFTDGSKKISKTNGEDSKEYPWSLKCHFFLPGSCCHIETLQHWSLQVQNLPFTAWTQHLRSCCLNLVYTLRG